MGLPRAGVSRFAIRPIPSSLLPGTELGFLALTFPEVPEGITLSKSATYHDDMIPGRTEPLKSYVNSGASSIDFTVKIVATGDSKPDRSATQLTPAERVNNIFNKFGLIGPTEVGEAQGFNTQARPTDVEIVLIQEVRQKVEFLYALTHAQYDAFGRAFPPPRITLEFGENWVREGVITSVTLTYGMPRDPLTLLCHHVDATLRFDEVNARPLGFHEARRGMMSATYPAVGQNALSSRGETATDAARRVAGA